MLIRDSTAVKAQWFWGKTRMEPDPGSNRDDLLVGKSLSGGLWIIQSNRDTVSAEECHFSFMCDSN